MTDDTISRAAAIKAINSHFGFNPEEEYGSAVKEVINALPSAERRGKWIPKDWRWQCDKCGCLVRRENPLKGNVWNYNFCPNCGAKMEGDENG